MVYRWIIVEWCVFKILFWMNCRLGSIYLLYFSFKKVYAYSSLAAPCDCTSHPNGGVCRKKSISRARTVSPAIPILYSYTHVELMLYDRLHMVFIHQCYWSGAPMSRLYDIRRKKNRLIDEHLFEISLYSQQIKNFWRYSDAYLIPSSVAVIERLNLNHLICAKLISKIQLTKWMIKYT